MFRLHEDPDRFGEALNFTEAQTTFSARLLEKDYYCTVLLEFLAKEASGLVFKGGTCLAKVHADFFRLSEDLDYVIPVANDNSRADRRKLISPMKAAFGQLAAALQCFQIQEPFAGANNSTQYAGIVNYPSLATGQPEAIKIEVALREPMLRPPVSAEARTALLNPLTEQVMIGPIVLLCLSKTEAFAEKFRAALSRREAAIRDFFDLDFAVRRLQVQPEDVELIGLVRQKLAVHGNSPIDVSSGRLETLRQQVEPRLQSVLRAAEFAEFDLDRAFAIVAAMAGRVM